MKLTALVGATTKRRFGLLSDCFNRGAIPIAIAGPVLLGALMSAGLAHAEGPAASAQAIQEMQAELSAIKAESEAAKAQEAERERQIDALQRKLDIAAGVTPTAPAEAAAAPPPTQISTLSPAVEESNPEANPLPPPGDRFEIYGFAQADYIQDFKRVDPNWADTLRPSKIPTTEGLFGSDGQSLISVKQSRFGVQGSEPVGGHDLVFKFEFDLFGVGVDAGQTTFRLRHAYGSWGPFLAGQTNSLFMDGDIFPNTIDYWGPTGMVFLRNPQFRITPYDNGKTKFAIALEKPGNDVDAGLIREIDPELGAALQPHNPYPDLTAQFRQVGGWGHVQLAGILRYVGYDTADVPQNEPKGSKLGWGIDVTSTLKTWKQDKLLMGVVYGQGIASYMNDGGTDLAPVLENPGPNQFIVAQAAPLLGLSFYYDHYWSGEFSTSLGWSETILYNTNFQEPSAYHTGQYASINFLWTPDKRLLFGTEFLYGRRQDFDGAVGDDFRLQFTAKYSFSSRGWFQ